MRSPPFRNRVALEFLRAHLQGNLHLRHDDERPLPEKIWRYVDEFLAAGRGEGRYVPPVTRDEIFQCLAIVEGLIEDDSDLLGDLDNLRTRLSKMYGEAEE